MIFVTLGTQDKSFDRLLQAIDKAIEKGEITEKVIVQAGYTKYESKNMEIFDLIGPDEFDKLINKCDLLITHGGVGSILSAVKKGKTVIGAARQKKYKEHTNDHQKQIIKEFAKDGYILELKDFNQLGKVLKKAKNFKPRKFKSHTKEMINLVEKLIEQDNHTSWYNKIKEILWYGFFGVLTTLINIISFYLLDKIGINVYLNVFISWFLSVLFAFITNKLFVFNSKSLNKEIILKEMASFFFFRILSLGIDMVGMYICMNFLKLSKMISKILMNIVIIIANYLFSKIFIFKEKTKE
ncbi:MAG TPA: GtrA family protein [Candidatus Faecimonas gallistercoris]|nr:GtrA family protein [Candidatus Faecimonas gallistercoris]